MRIHFFTAPFLFQHSLPFFGVIAAVFDDFLERLSGHRLDFLVGVAESDGSDHLPFFAEPFLQLIVSEEDIAGPETADVMRRRFEAHVLDRCADGLDVSELHHVLVAGVGLAVVIALGIDDKDDDRRLFEYARGVDGRRDEFLIALAENGRLVALAVSHDAFLQAFDHGFAFLSADDDEFPRLGILFGWRPKSGSQDLIQIFLRDRLLQEMTDASSFDDFFYHSVVLLYL